MPIDLSFLSTTTRELTQILPHVQALTHNLLGITGNIINGCNPPDVPWIIKSGEWIYGLARTISENSHLPLNDVLTQIMKSNGWASIPADVHRGFQVCMPPGYFDILSNTINSGSNAATCPVGSPDCFTKGIQTLTDQIPLATSTLAPLGTPTLGTVSTASLEAPAANSTLPIIGGVATLIGVLALVGKNIFHRSKQE